MGFNTAMVILNDQLNDIERDPHFGKKVSEAVREVYGNRSANWHNSFTVLPSQHADWDQFVVIGGNTIRSFEDLPEDEKLSLVKRLARQAGYRLSRIPT